MNHQTDYMQIVLKIIPAFNVGRSQIVKTVEKNSPFHCVLEKTLPRFRPSKINRSIIGIRGIKLFSSTSTRFASKRQLGVNMNSRAMYTHIVTRVLRYKHRSPLSANFPRLTDISFPYKRINEQTIHTKHFLQKKKKKSYPNHSVISRSTSSRSFPTVSK